MRRFLRVVFSRNNLTISEMSHHGKVLGMNVLFVSAMFIISIMSVRSAVPELLDSDFTERGSRTLPRWVLKTNLLYDATTTFNLGAEFRMGCRTTLELSGNYNPWTFKDNRKWKHVLVQPEFRWWMHETFNRNFVGVHAHYAFYNIGNLPHGPFAENMRDHRYEGWLAGVGVSYGHRWNFHNPRWALEATFGVGYAYVSYDKFPCGTCGERLKDGTRHYVGPTKIGLNFIYGFGVKDIPAPVEPIVIPKAIYEPKLFAKYVTPEVEAVKMRNISGQAYLEFRVGRWEILPDFRDNAAELVKIQETVESVKSDTDITITGVTIIGYASPEDFATRNQTLSDNRAKALRDHVAYTQGLRPELIASWGAGEDWKGLDSLVAASDMTEKEQLMEIIRGDESDLDRRENQLRAVAGGVPYRQIRAEMYPKLRRSDYRINYTVVPFTIEKGKEVLRTKPSSLSLNEMFLIANTYDQGSEAFNELFEIAARVFPDSDVANVNAAANALERKDAVLASYHLARVKVHDKTYWNNMGVLQWIQGDMAAAAESFAKSGAIGAQNAFELEKHIESTK